MRFINLSAFSFLSKTVLSASLLMVLAGVSVNEARAQSASSELPANLQITDARGNTETKALAPFKTAVGNDLYCAGFISPSPVAETFQIVGAEFENDRAHYSQGSVVYLNAGRSQNIQSGALYSIVRPKGDFRNPFKQTSGQRDLGIFTHELGVLRVTHVQENSSVAVIIFSCDEIQLGDLLRPFEERAAPTTVQNQPLPRYLPTSGRQNGRIVLQRYQHELLSPRDIVYIDLGGESGVKKGDKFTIFRYFPDDANIVRYDDDQTAFKRNRDYGSNTFKGGTYSIITGRENRQKVKNSRREVPRTIVGELSIISVQSRSATAIITRVTQEVHTGDHIEAQ